MPTRWFFLILSLCFYLGKFASASREPITNAFPSEKFNSGLAAKKTFTVVIDAGHGGHDRGATLTFEKNGQSFKIYESELNMKIARAIESLLETEHPGELRTILTREENSFLSLGRRTLASDEINPDLFLSLHFNSSHVESANGLEIYFSRSILPGQKDDPVSYIVNELEESGKLMESLAFAKELKNSWSYYKSNIKRAPFFVIEKNRAPSVLVEIGYLTNGADREWVLNVQNQDRIAKKIAAAILSFKRARSKELSDKE